MEPAMWAEKFIELPVEEQVRAIHELSDEEIMHLLYNWDFWARPNQRLPPNNANARAAGGAWTVWFPKCGRGWGKTRTGGETVRIWKNDFKYVNLAGPTASDARDVMIEGESGILAICPKDERPYYKKSENKLEWPNGAVSLIFTADEPERARGKQSEKLWCLIADTLITMGDGSEKRIADIQPGEFVLTRKGPRRVLGIAGRLDMVGTVLFSHGIMVTGTADHPLIDTLGRAVCLKELSIGQCVPTVTSLHTSDLRTRMVKLPESTSTDGYGNKPTGLFQQAKLFITKMVTGATTVWKISNSWISENMRRAMGRVSNVILARNTKSRPCSALVVEQNYNERITDRINIVGNAKTSELRAQDFVTSNVQFAVNEASPEKLPTAVSVVQTWREVGVKPVYDLLIDGEHEFYANRILSHNCDELASWRYRDAWDQLMFGLRLGSNPQALVTSTPKPTALVKELLNDPNTLVTHGSTYDNRANLAGTFFSMIIRKYEGTRLGRQELLGQVLDDNPNAVFHQELIDRDRLSSPKLVPASLARIVVAVDPAASSNEDSDETGIVVAAVDSQETPHYYILEDCSCSAATPNEWGRAAVEAYKRRRADVVVGELNNGGEMVEFVIKTVNPNVKFTGVRATRGKTKRAEPVGALYEQGRIHHVGYHATLEAQMCDFDPTIGDEEESYDRMDALVWAITELMDDSATSPEPVRVLKHRR